MPPKTEDHKTRAYTPAYNEDSPSRCAMYIIDLTIGVPGGNIPVAILVLMTSKGVVMAEENPLATMPAIKI